MHGKRHFSSVFLALLITITLAAIAMTVSSTAATMARLSAMRKLHLITSIATLGKRSSAVTCMPCSTTVAGDSYTTQDLPACQNRTITLG